MQVRRRPTEPIDPNVYAFYASLLSSARRPEVRRGVWNLWPCRPAWEGNLSSDQFIVFSWTLGERQLLVAVNYGPERAQCYAQIGTSGLRGRKFVLADMLTEARYEREGSALANGLYLDMPAWGVHAFAVEPI
jgi:hypothetical protein